MKTPEEWIGETDVNLLTCDGQGVKAKREALIKLLRMVQVDVMRQAMEDARNYNRTRAGLKPEPIPSWDGGDGIDYSKSF